MFLHTWIPQATFGVGSVTLALYGLMFALALIGAYGATLVLAKRFDRHLGTHFEDHVDGIFWWAFIPALVCARLLFVAYHPDYFIAAPSEVIAIWHGGIVWHGALVGGIIGSALYCAWKKISWFAFADMVAPALALGQAIGRWGNYFNQENYGLPTALGWGIPIDIEHRIGGYEQFAYFHPTFLYESKWDMLLFFILLYLLYRWVFLKKATWYQGGMIFSLYLVLYSTGRFLIEFLRIDTVPLFWGLRLPQWWSIDIVLLVVIFFFVYYRKKICPRGTCIFGKM